MRRKANPEPRLIMLRAARKKTKAGELFNADEMAAIAGMTWRNLKPQVEADPKWPVERRGSEGVAWVFDGRKVLDHMISKLEAEQRERDARDARVKKMVPKTTAAPPGIPIADLLKIDQLQTSVQRRKIEQREYVRRDEAESVITGLFTTMQSETLAVVSQLDPAGQWPPEVRASVADAVRSMLVKVHDRAAGWLTNGSGSGIGKGARRARQ